MALNDIHSPRNPRILNVTALAGEGVLDVGIQSTAGRVPVSRIVIKNVVGAPAAVRYGWKAGGPYWEVNAGEVKELGAVQPGDNKLLYFIRTGGTDLPFLLEIYN